MLDPWIIEEIRKKEEEKRRKSERQQPTVEVDLPQEKPEGDDRGEKPGHEMPSERKPGHEISNPNETTRVPVKKKEEEPKRGVDTSRITGGDDDEEDDGTIDILKELKRLDEKPPAPKPGEDAEKPSEKKPENKPD